MAISPINNVNNNIRNLSFGENLSNNTVENQSKPKISTQTKVILGTGLTALAAVGIYIATRGKTKGTTEKPIEQLKEIAVSQFKNSGNKFEKGCALTSSGEGYTGTLTHTTKNGKNVILKYENGLLVESKGEKFQKLYKYDDIGNKLKYVIDKNNNITFYNSDCSIPNGTKLFSQGSSKYHLRTPEGKHYYYNGTPSDFSLATKEIRVIEKNPYRRTTITKCKDDNGGVFYTVQRYCKNNNNENKKTVTIYDSKFKLIDGEQDNTILSLIREVKNIHKDIYKLLKFEQPVG